MSDNQQNNSTPEYEVEIPGREQLLELVTSNSKPVQFDEFIRHFGLDDERQAIGLIRTTAPPGTLTSQPAPQSLRQQSAPPTKRFSGRRRQTSEKVRDCKMGRICIA